ncbi:MAG TPA: hypothetical protein VD902_18665 [Symbiobacteriaceae bacterium]|nr:hypothetical protein [Symbiobacteriaceae bacterium]
MQDWDRWVFIVIGGGTGIYSGMSGWRSWKQRQKMPAIGDFLLAVTAVGLPVAFAFLGS